MVEPVQGRKVGDKEAWKEGGSEEGDKEWP